MRIFIFILILFIQNCTMAQNNEETWESYIARYENKLPGTTVVRMDLIKKAPISGFSNILVTGLHYKSPDDSGFPDSELLKNLQEIEDKIENFVKSKFNSIYVGSFMHNSKRVCYFYLNDSTNVRGSLEGFYLKNYPNFKNYIKVENDQNWEYYKEFLYPNEDIQNYLSDEKVVKNLTANGDKLDKARQVDHWSYFKNKQDAQNFKLEIEKIGYKTVKIEKIKDNSDFPYSVNFNKEEFVDLNSIYKITTNLRELSAKYNGDYDGWETFIIKD